MAKRKQSRERLPGEDDEAFYLRTLPKPPTIGSDDSVCMWMDDVLTECGPLALKWAFQAENFPDHLKDWRMRNNHWYAQLMNRANEAARRQAEQAARERQAREREQLQARRRAAGWA
jgi:hypothetical protein